jgi:DNA-binding transcriptional ArsR family regulator
MALQAVLEAVTDPHRRRILELVRIEELPAGVIAEHFEISRPAVSQHLGVLKAAGLVSDRRTGTFRYYRARPEGLRELRGYLDQFWSESLSRLKSSVEAEERRRSGGRGDP